LLKTKQVEEKSLAKVVPQVYAGKPVDSFGSSRSYLHRHSALFRASSRQTGGTTKRVVLSGIHSSQRSYKYCNKPKRIEEARSLAHHLPQPFPVGDPLQVHADRVSGHYANGDRIVRWPSGVVVTTISA
jgi:hypothetical protein